MLAHENQISKCKKQKYIVKIKKDRQGPDRISGLNITNSVFFIMSSVFWLLSSIQRLVFQCINAHNDIVHERRQPLRSGRCPTVSLSLFFLTSAQPTIMEKEYQHRDTSKVTLRIQPGSMRLLAILFCHNAIAQSGLVSLYAGSLFGG